MIQRVRTRVSLRLRRSARPLLRPALIWLLSRRERRRSGVVFNPLAPAYFQDPYPHYRALRERDPVHWSLLTRSWVLSRSAEIDAVLRDHRRFSSDDRHARHPRRGETDPLVGGRSMLMLDPPDHTRLRGLVAQAFTPRAIEALEPRIAAIAEELLAPLADGATFDLMDTLATPLPVTVIAEMLGVDPRDRAAFKRWSDDVARTLEPTLTDGELRRAQRSARELADYFRGMIAERRRAPREDLLSTLIAAEEAGDRLSEDEMLVTLRLLLVAGNETTTNLIGNGLLALLRHPEQLAALRADPAILPAAIEELLRFDSPVQADARTALEDTSIGGQAIRRGDTLILLIGSANRDPAVCADPDRLDVRREPAAAHIAFGRGIHHCLGAPLARLEGRIAFEALLRTFREIRPAADDVTFKDHVILRGLRFLPVTVRR